MFYGDEDDDDDDDDDEVDDHHCHCHVLDATIISGNYKLSINIYI